MNRKSSLKILALLAMPLVIYLVLLMRYTRERCPYEVKDTLGRYTLRICYEGSNKIVPSPEGYLVHANLYDQRGVLLERRLVDNVDGIEDVQKAFSNTRWDGDEGAFVDNAGREVLRVPPGR